MPFKHSIRYSLPYKICESCNLPYRECAWCKKPFRLHHLQKFCSSSCFKQAQPLIDAAIRFWRKVNKHGPMMRKELGRCWIWIGARRNGGYGVFHPAGMGRNATMNANKFAWEQVNGPVPIGKVLMHRCDYPPCIRPSHHCLGTQTENMRDASQKGRLKGPKPWQRGELHRNHKLTEEQVNEIRELRRQGWTLATLSKKFSISISNVHEIVSRQIWAHLS